MQNAQQAHSRWLAAQAAVTRDQAAFDAARKQLDVVNAGLQQAEANLSRAQAALNQAELNLSYTTILAPVAGEVGARSLRVGQYVQAGTQLMAVVPTQAAYIIANYKETQLADVRPGQAAEIEVDMFPGKVLKGRVDLLAPASGQEFALLPPDNATGNFTKVVQRIPVKIILDGGDSGSLVLRPGISVIPTIDTRTAAPQTQIAQPKLKPSPFWGEDHVERRKSRRRPGPARSVLSSGAGRRGKGEPLRLDRRRRRR